jgi:hypothetical protein
MAEELAAEAPDADSYDWPQPREGKEDDDPLYDSTRGYIEQIDRYKKHQGKPIERKPITRHTKTCEAPGCGKTFTSIRRDAKACSKKCTERLSNYKRKQQRQGA